MEQNVQQNVQQNQPMNVDAFAYRIVDGVTSLVATIKSLEANLKHAQVIIQEKDKSIKAAEENLSKKEAELAETRKSYHDQSELMDSVTEELTELKRDYAELKRSIGESDSNKVSNEESVPNGLDDKAETDEDVKEPITAPKRKKTKEVSK